MEQADHSETGSIDSNTRLTFCLDSKALFPYQCGGKAEAEHLRSLKEKLGE